MAEVKKWGGPRPGAGRRKTKGEQVIEVMEQAAAATAAHAERVEAIVGPDVRRSADRDGLIIELRRIAAAVAAENDLLKAENAALKKQLAARVDPRPVQRQEPVDAVGVPLHGKGKATIAVPKTLREKLEKATPDGFSCGGPGRCTRLGCQHR